MSAKKGGPKTLHGDAGKRTAEYVAWVSMNGRCSRPSSPEYRNYGGRGIAVCEAWRTNYETFIRDVGRRPSPQHTLDRIDNNGNYEPGNVRWATRHTQMHNTRATKLSFDLIERARQRRAQGETFVAIAADFGVDPSTLGKAVRGERWRAA